MDYQRHLRDMKRQQDSEPKISSESERRLPEELKTIDDTVEVSAEMSIAGTETVGEFETKGSTMVEHPSRRPRNNNTDYVYLKNVPRDIINEVRSVFPNAGNMVDALSAYVVVMSGRMIEGLSDNVMQLVKDYDGDSSLLTIEDQLRVINNKLNALTELSTETHVGTSYMLLDRLGFRQENPPSVEKVNFNEHGLIPLRSRLKAQTSQIKSVEIIKDGRPKKGIKGE